MARGSWVNLPSRGKVVGKAVSTRARETPALGASMEVHPESFAQVICMSISDVVTPKD